MLLCLHYNYLASSLSHEAKRLLQSARANILYIFFITYVTTPQIIKLLSVVTVIGL